MNAALQQAEVNMKYDLLADWTDKNILLVGMGQTGLSCAKFLHQHGLSFSVADSRNESAGISEFRKTMPEVSITTGKFDSEQFNAADILVVSPGVSINEPAIQIAKSAGKVITGDVDIFCQLVDKPIIAITGSNGKSTVTQLLGDAINASSKSALIGGNIGIPVLDLLVQPEPDFYVLELSSFQLETTSNLKNHVACLLNISEDHLDRYDSCKEYATAKSIVLNNARKIVASFDDENINKLLSDIDIDTDAIETVSESDSRAKHFLAVTEQGIKLKSGPDIAINAEEFTVSGKHNYTNILFVLAVLKLIEIDVMTVINTIKKFSGLKHRCQTVLLQNNVEWINDSKATNVGASLAAINGLSDKPIILLLGGQAKGQDFTPLAPAIQCHVKSVAIYGQDADKIAREINIPEKTSVFENLEAAVVEAVKNAKPGYRILLSPACASFDQFKNFEHRGDMFEKLAQQYGCAI